MKLGLQLFTLIDTMQKPDGLKKVLKIAADAGYDGVEFAGFWNTPVDEILEELDKNNLVAAGFHLGWPGMNFDLLESNPDEVITTTKKLGMRALVVASYPAKTREEWINFARRMDKVGALCRENGILLGYHNHRVEAKKLDGEYPIDTILSNCAPENVFWELDPRHIMIPGTDPVELAKKHAGRMPFMHMRDLEKITGEDTGDDCAVGEGMVDFPALVEASGEHEWLVVEEGSHPDIEAHIVRSAKYIRDNFIK